MLTNPSKYVFYVDSSNFLIPVPLELLTVPNLRCVCFQLVLKKVDAPSMGFYSTLNSLGKSTVLKWSFRMSANPSITCPQSHEYVPLIHHRHPSIWGGYSGIRLLNEWPQVIFCLPFLHVVCSDCWHQYNLNTKLSPLICCKGTQPCLNTLWPFPISFPSCCFLLLESITNQRTSLFQ